MTTVVTFAREGKNAALLLSVPLFINCGFPHCLADAFYYLTVPTSFTFAHLAEVLMLYPCLVIGNFIGCNLYRFIAPKLYMKNKVKSMSKLYGAIIITIVMALSCLTSCSEDIPTEVIEHITEETEHLEYDHDIPVIRITTNSGTEILDKSNYIKGVITISEPTVPNNETFDMSIKGRGNSTWTFPKKPWKIKLDKRASLLDMPADKEWILLANYADRTLIRNIVSMKLSEICGFSWTPRMRSIEVYLNNDYQGVYTLCEHKKISPDRVNIDVVGRNDNEGESLTGGYYLEIEGQMDEIACWETSMGVPMMFQEPEEPTEQQLEYIKNYFNSFEQALQARDWSSEYGYPKYINVDSFVNYYIVQELTKNIDGHLYKSSFITKEKGKKLEMYHLWDFDLALGNCGYFISEVGNGPENFWIKEHCQWYPLLFEDSTFVKKFNIDGMN